MASSSLSVYVEGQEIRKYGGNRSDVKSLKSSYERMSLEQLNKKHPIINESNIKTVEFYARFNKR